LILDDIAKCPVQPSREDWWFRWRFGGQREIIQ
jgi:hypothetical protein